MKKIALTLSFLIALLMGAQSQNTLNQLKLDSLITTLDVNNRAMFTISIAEKGNVIYHRSVGYMDTSLSVKANENTKYRIGSISKMFTSIIIFQLIEAKKLTLDTKLSKFFPKVKNSSKITIGDMLSHQSGIHNFTADSTFLVFSYLPRTHKEMLDLIYSMPTDFEPRTKQEYSNSNFVLLGYIIEKLTKKTYADNVKERITEKIGLRNTYYGTNANLDKNESRSFYWRNEKWGLEKETDMSVPHAAGAMVSTTNDLVKFAHALFSGKFISQTSIDTMTRLRHEWGLGIFPMKFKNRTGFGHNGGIDEFGSQLKYFTDDSLSIAITCNGAHFSMNDCMKGALSCYYNETYSIPTFVNYQVSEDILKQYLGTYSSNELKMDLVLTLDRNSLMLAATGQKTIILEASSDTTFDFKEAAAVFEFKKEETGVFNEVMLHQGGMNFPFFRKK